MADRGPNPNLWMVTAGPCQPLKGVFYIQTFYPKILRFWSYFYSINSSLTVLVIVDQAIVQLHYSAHLRWSCYVHLVQSNCFVI